LFPAYPTRVVLDRLCERKLARISALNCSRLAQLGSGAADRLRAGAWLESWGHWFPDDASDIKSGNTAYRTGADLDALGPILGVAGCHAHNVDLGDFLLGTARKDQCSLQVPGRHRAMRPGARQAQEVWIDPKPHTRDQSKLSIPLSAASHFPGLRFSLIWN